MIQRICGLSEAPFFSDLCTHFQDPAHAFCVKLE